MRTQVILIPIGSAGDVFPFLALGQELQRRKHHVAVMTNPMFKKNVGQAGLEFIDLGSEESLREAGTDHRLHQAGQAWKLALRWGAIGTMRQTVAYLQQRRQVCPTLLVASPLSFGAKLASEAFDIPLASVILSPFVLRSVYDAPTIKPMWLGDWMPQVLKSLQYKIADQFFIDPVVKQDVNALQSELGLSQSERFLHQWCFSNDVCVGAFDPTFAPAQPDWPDNLHLTGHYVWDPPVEETDTERFAEFIGRDNRRLAVISAGSAGPSTNDFYQNWTDAVLDKGCKVLILERDGSAVPELGEHAMHLTYFPMGDVLKHAAAVVHSGGIGATLRTLTAAVPQLILPRVNDQFDNADRVQRLKAGLVGGVEMNNDQIRSSLNRLLTGNFEFVAPVRNPGASVSLACDKLESVLHIGN